MQLEQLAVKRPQNPPLKFLLQIKKNLHPKIKRDEIDLNLDSATLNKL